MKIYVSHSRDFDYTNELYEPLRNSELGRIHTFIFPHAESNEPMDAKKLFMGKGCDMVLAECSLPATGQGIELGWASLLNIPIYCIYKAGSKPSKSAKMVSMMAVEYSGSSDLISQLTDYLNKDE